MNSRLALLLTLTAVSLAAPCRATILPDACGDDKVKFDVATQKNAPAPTAPAAGQAQVVFIEKLDKGEGVCIGCNFGARVGMDGSWVGANKGNSYFALVATPGEHHLCAAPEGIAPVLRKKVGMADFVAEVGKVYYFEVLIAAHPGEVSGATNGPVSQSAVWSFDLKQLSEDEGKYLVKVSALSVPKPK